MAWRPKPKGADVDPVRPRTWATCDGCGFVLNLNKLDFQREWAGATMINKRLLKCPRCLDIPQEQLRSIVLPPDPDPVINTRPEPYDIDEGLIGTFVASIALDPTIPDGARMTVTNVTSGAVGTGAVITSGAVAGTVIGDQISGTLNGVGDYEVTPKQTASSTTMIAASGAGST